MTIEYDGTAYSGWQVQPNAPTVQGTLEAALASFMGNGFRLVGASRTDRGVHARGQVASLHLDGEDDPARVRAAANGNLPGDIYVKEVVVAEEGFDARKSSRGKRYVYTMVVGKSPLMSRFAWEYLWGELDLALLQEMAAELVGQRDMRNLSPGCGDNHGREGHKHGASASELGHGENTVVTITRARWEKNGNTLVFTVEGDRFLFRLVRNLVGLMVGVAGGRLDREEFAGAMRGQETRIFTAPARGLCLDAVFYGDGK
jgi:tRNA pseudouridine38-40 synthase